MFIFMQKMAYELRISDWSSDVCSSDLLGKILVHGPDAGEFLNRIYVNNLKTLKVGKCRYGLMLNEFGIIIDDGIATRWGESTYQVGTTSGQAEHVVEILEEWLQCEWVDLRSEEHTSELQSLMRISYAVFCLKKKKTTTHTKTTNNNH